MYLFFHIFDAVPQILQKVTLNQKEQINYSRLLVIIIIRNLKFSGPISLKILLIIEVKQIQNKAMLIRKNGVAPKISPESGNLLFKDDLDT